LVEALQLRFKTGLERLARARGVGEGLIEFHWLRDQGRHGGGSRFASTGDALFNRAAINVSHVHYDDDPNRKLGSATALSTIIHPAHPRAPSLHLHLSWTERKGEAGTWRMMADLNPSLTDAISEAEAEAYAGALRELAPSLYEEAAAQGDRYFFIPALERCRGATHFYLEGYASDDPRADLDLARHFGEVGIDRYLALLEEALALAEGESEGESGGEPSADQRARQLAYHTLYLYQVLTLDRGTTSGILVHSQNDLGIMGSLPSRVDRALLSSWEARTPELQRPLLRGLVAALPEGASSLVGDGIRERLAEVVRAHYRAHPEALALQASGGVLPPTIENHQAERS